jgi:hypothetical protein
MDVASSLAAELLLMTLALLPCVDVLSCRRVCRRWRYVASDALLWDRHVAALPASAFNYWSAASLAAFGRSVTRYSCLDDDGAVDAPRAVQEQTVRRIDSAGGVLDDVTLDLRTFLAVRGCLRHCRTVRLCHALWPPLQDVCDLEPMPAVTTLNLIHRADDVATLASLFPNLKTLHLTSVSWIWFRVPTGLYCLHIESPLPEPGDVTRMLKGVARPPATIVLTCTRLLFPWGVEEWVRKCQPNGWWSSVVELNLAVDFWGSNDWERVFGASAPLRVAFAIQSHDLSRVTLRRIAQ